MLSTWPRVRICTITFCCWSLLQVFATISNGSYQNKSSTIVIKCHQRAEPSSDSSITLWRSRSQAKRGMKRKYTKSFTPEDCTTPLRCCWTQSLDSQCSLKIVTSFAIINYAVKTRPTVYMCFKVILNLCCLNFPFNWDVGCLWLIY